MKLKACPCCGGEAELRNAFYDDWVECTECGIGTNLNLTKEEAIASWERRVDTKTVDK